MRVIDVGAHLHEPLDWLAQTDPTLAEALGPPARFMEIANALFGIFNPEIKVLGDSQQPTGGCETILPGFVHHLEMTDTRQPETAGQPTWWPGTRTASLRSRRSTSPTFRDPSRK